MAWFKLKKRNNNKKTTKLAGTHHLVLESLRFYWRHWRKLGAVALWASAIDLMLKYGLSVQIGAVYQSIWFVFASCALIWAIRHLEDTSTPVSTSKAYYGGSAPALRFFLSLLLIWLVLIPFLVGYFIYSGLMPYSATAIETAMLGAIWLGLSIVSLFLFARSAFIPIIVTLPDIRPLQALRLSWKMSRGRANRLVLRLLLPICYLVALSIGVVWVLSFIPLLVVAQIVAEILIYLALIPVSYIYLHKLYRNSE